MSETTEKIKKEKKRGGAGSVLHGRWLSTNFLSRHWGLILAFVILIMIYITNRYQCITTIETIDSLKTELQVVKSERIRVKSEYMSNIREAAMKERLARLGIKLSVREQPPFQLEIPSSQQ